MWSAWRADLGGVCGLSLGWWQRRASLGGGEAWLEIQAQPTDEADGGRRKERVMGDGGTSLGSIVEGPCFTLKQCPCPEAEAAGCPLPGVRFCIKHVR